MMNPGSLSTRSFGTREHVGTPKSYLPIYNTHIFIYPYFSPQKIYENRISRVLCVPSVENTEVLGTDERSGHCKSNHEVP